MNISDALVKNLKGLQKTFTSKFAVQSPKQTEKPKK